MGAALLSGYGIAMPVGAAAGLLHWAAGTALVIVAGWMTMAAVRRYHSTSGAPRARLALRIPLRAYTVVAAVTVVNPGRGVAQDSPFAIVVGEHCDCHWLTPGLDA